MKTSELTGRALDLAVGVRTGMDVRAGSSGAIYLIAENGHISDWKPATDWAQGGPLIQSGHISVVSIDGYDFWKASRMDAEARLVTAYGPTALIAGMRCFASHFEIPEEEVK